MPNRSARAAFVFLNDLLYQLASAFISLIVNPLIIANLGADIFGAWKIIDKTVEFLTLGNFKPLGFLQLTLAKDISNNDFIYKQHQIGAAISILVLSLPIVLILAFLLFYFRDTFVPVPTEISYQVKITLLVMLFFKVISPFLWVPDYIVRGLNMQYLRFGVCTISAVIMALFQYNLVAQGYTLPWFAAASSLPMLISAIVSYSILVKNVPWFKVVWPPEILIRLFFKSNLWMLFVELFRYILSLADLILIGIYFGTTTAAIYSLTKTLIIFLLMPANSLVSATLPGIGDLIGRNDMKTLLQLRSEQINVAIFLGFVIGMVLVFFNGSFIQLWVGEKHFGGEALSRWLIVANIIDVLVKTEANYLDASLKLKMQTSYLGIASIVYLVTVVLCKPILGLNVIPISQIVSQAVLIALYWIGFRDFLHIKVSNIARIMLRPLCIAIFLASSALWIQLPAIQSWIELFAQAFGVAILSGIVGWFLILQKNDRKKLMARLSNVFKYRRIKQ